MGGIDVACYWKVEENNTVTQYDLSDGDYDAEASSICSYGDDIYIAGHYNNASGTSQAVYWKNEKTNITVLNGNDANAIGIHCDGTDVHIAGDFKKNDRYEIAYWKNTSANEVQVTSSGGIAQFFSRGMCVDGNDVYICGKTYWGDWSGWPDDGTYWKLTNGVVHGHVDIHYGPGKECDTDLNSIIVHNNDVYVAGYKHFFDGYIGIWVPCAKYWENGITNAYHLNNSAVAYDIAVYGNDIYVVGRQVSWAMLWKNDSGESVDWDADGNTRAYGICIGE